MRQIICSQFCPAALLKMCLTSMAQQQIIFTSMTRDHLPFILCEEHKRDSVKTFWCLKTNESKCTQLLFHIRCYYFNKNKMPKMSVLLSKIIINEYNNKWNISYLLTKNVTNWLKDMLYYLYYITCGKLWFLANVFLKISEPIASWIIFTVSIKFLSIKLVSKIRNLANTYATLNLIVSQY